jgi:F0F1-type ATP synthase assembly protein I
MANLWRRAGVYMDIIYTFPGAIGVGTAAGWLLDRWLKTAPYLTLAGFLVGLAGAFWYLFKMLSVMSKRGDKGPGAGG